MSTCASDFLFDRYLGNELDDSVQNALEKHVLECPRCTSRLALLREARAETEAALPSFASLAASVTRADPVETESPGPQVLRRGRILPRVGATLGALALAASLVLAFRTKTPTPEPGAETGTRSKGASNFELFVKRGDSVRQGGPGEVLAPGDAVAFAVTTLEPRFVAVLSVDGKDHASAYFPLGERAEHVAVGRTELPLSTILDDTLGRERLWLLLCDQPVELLPVLRALESNPEAPLNVSGCTSELLQVEKRRP